MAYLNPEPVKSDQKTFRIRTVFVLVVLGVSVLMAGAVWLIGRQADKDEKKAAIMEEDISYEAGPQSSADFPIEEEWRFNPGPISMELVKKKGCVADGLLSEFGEENKEIAKTINRSECIYLHRALETWLDPPDFDDARKVMQKIEKRPIVFGMFLAEAISTRKNYEDPGWEHDFEFERMCQDGTEGRWGDKTCIPDIEKPEYRRYLKSITQRAMDLGIQSFLFGQVQLQDKNPSYGQTQLKQVLDDMRKYAKGKNMEIIIGGQTNSITDEKYLRMFDYIEGGVGISASGGTESGPCHSNFSSCWALLWHDRFKQRANNVLIHLDWSGLTWDDMGVFARMEHEKRIKTLETLYKKFTSRDVGFLMPFLAVLNKENNGCYGPDKNFYTPSKKFKCKDEEDINKIMRDHAFTFAPQRTEQ